MKNKSLLREILTEKLDMPIEVIYDLPLIKITGMEKLIIENQKGIIEYSNEIIRLSSKIGIIKITGNNIVIKKIDENFVEIEGKIISVEFIK